MSQWKCSVCPEIFTSMAAIRQHCLEKHNSYLNPPKPELKDLTIQTLESFRTTKQKVHWLLKAKPSTRGDDMLLYLEFMKYFEEALIYTPESQRITFKDPNGITYKQFQYLTSWETCRRTRQKIMETDKKLFHGKDGEIIKEHECLLPSERVSLKRERREAVIRANVKYL